MNRTAVKNFAQWGRRALHELVRARLALFGVTEKGVEAPQRIQGGLIVGGQTLTLSSTDLGQYDALIRHHHELSGTPKDRYALLVDEIAYSWFNRLAALRYMEVHGYAERALSSDQPGQPDPNVLRDAVTLAAQGDLGEHVSPDTVAGWQRLYQPGEVYRRLLVAYSGTFAHSLPFLFSRERAWLDLFLPDTLLNQDSFVRRMVQDIPEADWQDIEIVGWLYQFYISERKDEVFAQKGKYTPRDIPAATQLFTPHWIVRYMVENSLGRVWLEAHPESGLREHMPYYLESENPAPPPNPDLTPESLSVMDPACGSGHILVYAFDLLAHIYRERGYSEREIPALILEHNLHGLDIDERAAQLASFAVVMKARELNSRLFRRDMPTLNILQVRSTRGLRLPNSHGQDLFGRFSAMSNALTDADEFNPDDWQPLVDAFADADHLGSLITPPPFDAGRLQAQLHWLEERGGLDAGALDELSHLLKQAELLGRKYDAVVANPPYVGNRNLNINLRDFLEKDYRGFNSDLFSASVIRFLAMCEAKGSTGFMTPFVWMFIASYQDLREKILQDYELTSLVQLEYSGFEGATVPICAYTIKNVRPMGNKAEFIKLTEFVGSYQQGPKTLEAAADKSCSWRYRKNPHEFLGIPGKPLTYWISESAIEAFSKDKNIGIYFKAYGQNVTGDNDRFVRLVWEVSQGKVNGEYWRPYAKGGGFRRWGGTWTAW